MSFTDIINHLWLGLSSSFIGTLPLGMLNLTVLQLSLANQHRQAMAFSAGVVMVEFCQILATLLGMNLLLSIPQLTTGLTILSIPILFYLGIKNLKIASNNVERNSSREAAVLEKKNAFRQGLVLSAANVLVYPFWLLWGSIFVQNGWLMPRPEAFGLFSLGASAGTLGAFWVFIFLGKNLSRYLLPFQSLTNRLIAFAFLGFGLAQFIGLLKK